MTTKTFTLTAEVEYDPTATSVAGMAPTMHRLLQDGFNMELLDDHGELCVHSCVVSEGPPEEGPPKLFDEDNWTDYGNTIARRVDSALKHIVEECRDDGVDLRHAAFIVEQQVSTAFLQAHLERWLVKSKKKKAKAS